MPRTSQVPEAGVVDGFNVKLLFHADGRRFVPETVQENNCYLARILQSDTSAVLVESARSALRNGRQKDPHLLLNDVFEAADSRLKAMFDSRTTMETVLDYLEFDYGLVGFRAPRPNSLEREMFARGVYTADGMADVLWLSYLSHSGVRNISPLIDYIARAESSIAPPITLRPAGCKEGIDYTWPTVSRPITSFPATKGGGYVHWGFCPSSEELWVYSYGRGWKVVADDEAKEFCMNAAALPEGGLSAKLLEFCKSRH